jgi:asparagine synthase (glutamine-hydrolysing)
VWDRPKRGFELPFARWLGHELREEVGRALTSDEGTRRVGLDAGATRDVWLDFLGGRAGVSWSRPWALYTLIRWAEHNDLAVPAHGAREETDQSRDLWAAVTPRDS